VLAQRFRVWVYTFVLEFFFIGFFPFLWHTWNTVIFLNFFHTFNRWFGRPLISRSIEDLLGSFIYIRLMFVGVTTKNHVKFRHQVPYLVTPVQIHQNISRSHISVTGVRSVAREACFHGNHAWPIVTFLIIYLILIRRVVCIMKLVLWNFCHFRCGLSSCVFSYSDVYFYIFL